jgi:hypothetical protein
MVDPVPAVIVPEKEPEVAVIAPETVAPEQIRVPPLETENVPPADKNVAPVDMETFPFEKELAPRVQPPIVPEDAYTEPEKEPAVALMVPDTFADVATSAPAGVTLNGAEAKAAFPNWIPLALAIKILLLEPIDTVPPKVELPMLSHAIPVAEPKYPEPAFESHIDLKPVALYPASPADTNWMHPDAPEPWDDITIPPEADIFVTCLLDPSTISPFPGCTAAIPARAPEATVAAVWPPTFAV